MKERGSATIAELAPLLGLTGEAVRQQLLQLRNEGWVVAKVDRTSMRGRTGRPSTQYRLSSAGEHLFPKQYDSFVVQMFDAVGHELGAGAAVRVLERVSNERIADLEPTIEGRSFEDKLAALKDWYVPDDPHMNFETDGSDFLMVERNCPYYNAAMDRPELCSVTVNAMSRLLGVRVERQETFQKGDGRCVFHVFSDEPVTDEHFELEPKPPKPS